MLLLCGGARRHLIGPIPRIPFAAGSDQLKSEHSLSQSSVVVLLHCSSKHFKIALLTSGTVNTIEYSLYKWHLSITRSRERGTPSPIHMSGRGRGNRGEYYKNKYGRGSAGRFGSGRQGHQSPKDDGSSPSNFADQLRNHGGAQDLMESLRRLEGSTLQVTMTLLNCEEQGGRHIQDVPLLQVRITHDTMT